MTGQQKRIKESRRVAVTGALDDAARRNTCAHPKAGGAPGGCVAELMHEVRAIADAWAEGKR